MKKLLLFVSMILFIFIFTSCSSKTEKSSQASPTSNKSVKVSQDAYALAESASNRMSKLNSFDCEIDTTEPESTAVASSDSSGNISTTSVHIPKTECQYKKVNSLITYIEKIGDDSPNEEFIKINGKMTKVELKNPTVIPYKVLYSDGKNEFIIVNGKTTKVKLKNPTVIPCNPLIFSKNFLKNQKQYKDGEFNIVQLVFDGEKMQKLITGSISENNDIVTAGDDKITLKINSSGLIVDYQIDSGMTVNNTKTKQEMITDYHYSNFNGNVNVTISSIT
jgi:hypothetical protein